MRYDIELALVFWSVILLTLLVGSFFDHLNTTQGLSLSLVVAMLLGAGIAQLYHLMKGSE